MAPSNGSSKSRRAGHTRQPSKPVVPAIPLPHVKRQAAAAAAASVPDAPSPTVPRPEKHDTNGVVPTEIINKERLEPVSGTDPVAESRSADGTKPPTSPARDTNKRDAAATQNGKPIDLDPSTLDAELNGSFQGPGSTATITVEPKKTVEAKPELPTSAAASETPVIVNGGKARNEPKHKLGDHPSNRPLRSRPQNTVSPTRYHMPQPFQPAAARHMGMMANGDMHRGPKHPLSNGPAHLHQAHPSNSSVHFGTFHESANSSPAPPHSGGIAPPPGMPMPDGRQPYMAHAVNGFPPMLPYGVDMMPGANFDSYGRPAMYPPMDAYPPYGNNFGPSTPHSFHDSQSSAPPEDNGVYNQYPPAGLRNGMGVPGEELQHQNHQGRMFGAPDYPRMMPNLGVPPHMMSPSDEADGLVAYLQQQFGSPELADCTLELRYLDDRAPPVRIPGHQIILCRSPELSRVQRNQGLHPSPSDRSMQIILLETDNRWIRSDSFYMAVQRLYGFHLLPVPPPRSNDPSELTNAGTTHERFDFSLSYAASGHLLGWTPVVRRGCEVATHLLDWHMLEKALDFALDGYSDRGSHEVYKYGDGSRILLGALVTFIVHNLPFSFSLDTSVVDPEPYRRLPAYPPPPAPPAQPELPSTMPAIAKGSSVHLGKGRRPQNLSSIQFGDLSLTDSRNGAGPEAPKTSPQEQSAFHEILSRVLLNLPFTQLKMILESSGSGNVNGWANAESRYRTIKDAVAEREARRLRALDAVLAGRVRDAESILTRLRSPEPQPFDHWGVLGWQEEILPYGNADGPALGRKWVSVADALNVPVAAYP